MRSVAREREVTAAPPGRRLAGPPARAARLARRLPNAAGLGIYDGKSSPSGIKTAASWLGSASSIKYAQDFIDASDWSHISNPWQLPNWKGTPYTMVWGCPHAAVRAAGNAVLHERVGL